MGSSYITDYTQEVSRGNIVGFEIWNKFGYNQDVDTGSAEVVASWGGTYTYLTAASTLSVVSDSGNDASGGTGSRQVLIYGVDENFDHITELVTLNGLTPVVTTNSFYGVNRIANISTGSTNANVGTITVTATTGGSTQAQMPAGEGTTEQCIFHIGINKIFNATYLEMNINKISGGGSPRVTVSAWTYSHVTQSKYKVFSWTVDTAVENSIDIRPTEPFVLTGRQVIWFEASTDTLNTIVNLRFGGKLINA